MSPLSVFSSLPHSRDFHLHLSHETETESASGKWKFEGGRKLLCGSRTTRREAIEVHGTMPKQSNLPAGEDGMKYSTHNTLARAISQKPELWRLANFERNLLYLLAQRSTLPSSLFFLLHSFLDPNHSRFTHALSAHSTKSNATNTTTASRFYTRIQGFILESKSRVLCSAQYGRLFRRRWRKPGHQAPLREERSQEGEVGTGEFTLVCLRSGSLAMLPSCLCYCHLSLVCRSNLQARAQVVLPLFASSPSRTTISDLAPSY